MEENLKQLLDAERSVNAKVKQAMERKYADLNLNWLKSPSIGIIYWDPSRNKQTKKLFSSSLIKNRSIKENLRMYVYYFYISLLNLSKGLVMNNKQFDNDTVSNWLL